MHHITASTSTSLNPNVSQRNVATPPLQISLSDSVSVTNTKRKASTLDTFVTKTTSYEKANLNEEVAKMVFATNSPFRLVEHPQFCKMVGKLRPGYTPPTRNEIANKYLPMIYDREYGKCAKELMNETVSLIRWMIKYSQWANYMRYRDNFKWLYISSGYNRHKWPTSYS